MFILSFLCSTHLLANKYYLFHQLLNSIHRKITFEKLRPYILHTPIKNFLHRLKLNIKKKKSSISLKNNETIRQIKHSAIYYRKQRIYKPQ